MKLVPLLAAALTVANGIGGTVVVTNNDGLATESIVDNAGNPIVAGYAAIGTIAEPGRLPTVTTGGEVADIFDVFGSPTTIGATVRPIQLNGVFSVEVQGDFSTDPVRGRPIYLVLGNAPDLRSSSQVGVLRVGTFPSMEPAIPVITLHRDSRNVELFRGSYLNFALSPGTAFGQAIDPTPAFALGVPEPSGVVLFTLAGMTFLARRRRAMPTVSPVPA